MSLFEIDPRSRIVVASGCSTERSSVDLGIEPGVEFDRVICLYDPNVEEHAVATARAFGAEAMIEVVGNEASKSLSTVAHVCEQLRQHRCTRRSLLVNVGGGVITDIGGFVASVYMRGIEFVNVPSSMLGMCDAAVGGKNGVDLGPYKNLVGTFCQPRLTLVDPELIATLPSVQLREGLVEVVKMAAILDAGVFAWLEANMIAVLAGEPEALNRCIEQAVLMKFEVVMADVRERGRRILLNFGHTVGHGIEAISQFATSHARAVSIGMVWEMQIANSRDREQVGALLQLLEMPTAPYEHLDLDARWQAMQSDKKCDGGAVRIAVPAALGQGTVVEIREGQLCM